MNKISLSLLSQLLYGRNLNNRIAITTGCLFGIIGYMIFESGYFSAAIPNIPFVFISFIVTPLMFFSLMQPLFHDICNPRRKGITFLLGISCSQRQHFYINKVKEINIFLILVVVTSNMVSLGLNGLFNREMYEWFLVIFFPIPIIASYCLSWMAIFVTNSGFLKPKKNDNSASRDSRVLMRFSSVFIRFTWKLSGVMTLPLSGRVRLITRRQLLDLFRYDSFNSILLPVVAAVFSIILNFLFKDANKVFGQLLYVICAYGVVAMNFSSMIDSSTAISKLRSYEFTVRELFFANCYMFFILSFLVHVAYAFTIVLKINYPIHLFQLVQYVTLYVYLIVVASYWYTLNAIAENDAILKILNYTFMIIAIPSLFIPRAGLFFPLIICLLVLLVEKNVLQTVPFHRLRFNALYRK